MTTKKKTTKEVSPQLKRYHKLREQGWRDFSVFAPPELHAELDEIKTGLGLTTKLALLQYAVEQAKKEIKN